MTSFTYINLFGEIDRLPNCWEAERRQRADNARAKKDALNKRIDDAAWDAYLAVHGGHRDDYAPDHI